MVGVPFNDELNDSESEGTLTLMRALRKKREACEFGLLRVLFYSSIFLLFL
jgi:hypothetical protein